MNPSIIEAGDGISIDAASRVWLDRLTFRWIGDGFVNVTAGSSALTLSWIHFDGRSDDACGGHHPRANELTDAEATIHHSFYDRDGPPSKARIDTKRAVLTGSATPTRTSLAMMSPSLPLTTTPWTTRKARSTPCVTGQAPVRTGTSNSSSTER